MELLKWLEEWYQAECNGDWEHCYGIKIYSLDNPGWTVLTDITETYLENKPFNEIRYDNGDEDWLICSVKSGEFKGSGDPSKLTTILQIFKDWVES